MNGGPFFDNPLDDVCRDVAPFNWSLTHQRHKRTGGGSAAATGGERLTPSVSLEVPEDRV